MQGPLARIAALLGVTDLAATTEASLQRLVDGEVREDADLDFKESLYGTSDSERRALAGDVAALANSAGGVLILGVREERGRASGRSPVHLGEDEELRMRQAVAAAAAPVPRIEAIHRVTSATDGEGYYVVVVPRSADRPHAVRVNEALRYPVRNGPSTRYLSESEVADAYRSRFRMAEEAVGQVRRVEDEGVERLGRDELPWLVLSLVPDNEGAMELDYATLTAMQDWVHAFEFPRLGWAVFRAERFQASAGVRRVILTQAVDDGTGLSSYGHIELHTDGSGFSAVPIWSARRENPSEELLRLNDELLVSETAVMLRALATHARDNAHTSGLGVARLAVENSVFGSEVTFHPEPLPMALTHERRVYSGGELGKRRLREVPASERTVDLDSVASSARDLLVATRTLLSDLFQAFGVPHPLQLDTEGRVCIAHVSSENRGDAEAWIATTDAGVSDQA